MKQPIHVFAKWQVKEAHLNTVLELLARVTKESTQEEGNLFYKVHQSNTEPNTLVLFEGYKHEQALAIHRNSAHFQTMVVGEIVPLLENREVILATELSF